MSDDHVIQPPQDRTRMIVEAVCGKLASLGVIGAFKAIQSGDVVAVWFKPETTPVEISLPAGYFHDGVVTPTVDEVATAIAQAIMQSVMPRVIAHQKQESPGVVPPPPGFNPKRLRIEGGDN